MAKVISGEEMKNRLLQKIEFNTRYGRMTREKIKPNFTYQRGHPAGWTDDLGIISDKNQYIREELSGWRSQVDPRDYYAMRQWCEQNFEHDNWYTGAYYIVINNEKDVVWFMLRWT